MPELHFKGKEFVYNHHLSVPYCPLVPDPKKSIGGADLSGNLIVHGDNLIALKALLPHYAGKVDCVFIDPPYNTGNENWSYNDNVNSPIMREWLNSNPVNKEDMLRHDKWLSMMWPRLKLLWELLSEDGSIFVTCDDNEAVHLGAILSEICQEACFISCIVWQKVFARKNKAQISGSHDYIYVYSKRGLAWKRNLLDRSEGQTEAFSNRDKDPRGDWQSVSFSVQTENAAKRKEYRYDIKLPSGRIVQPPAGRHWNGLKARYDELKADGRFWYGEDGDSPPREKVFLEEVQKGIVPDTWWGHKDSGNNQEAKKELNEIFGSGDVFPNPKPTRLIERVLHIATRPDSVVLDSFAGSGTTGHAVLALNQRDGGNRKFILIETEDYADTVTAERVRRVIKGYKFTGTQHEELLREPITWTTLNKSHDLVARAESFDLLDKHRFDRIVKTVKNGSLVVTGEKKVTKRVDGLGGEFTYSTLGEPMDLDKLLTGESLPKYNDLGAWLFHTATGEALNRKTVDSAKWLLGESTGFFVWLVYKPDVDFLKSRDAALTLELAERIAKHEGSKGKDKRHLVFAPAKYVPNKMLLPLGVEHAPLPFALYRLERS